jgi:hypothetical protein
MAELVFMVLGMVITVGAVHSGALLQRKATLLNPPPCTRSCCMPTEPLPVQPAYDAHTTVMHRVQPQHTTDWIKTNRESR